MAKVRIAKDRHLFADPKGWTSKVSGSESVTRMLASTLGVPTSNIKNIIEQRNRDQYVFSYKSPSTQPEAFYLFSSGSADTFQVENPHTQKDLWNALKHNDWYKRLTLKAL